jgi:hypothetical protein
VPRVRTRGPVNGPLKRVTCDRCEADIDVWGVVNSVLQEFAANAWDCQHGGRHYSFIEKKGSSRAEVIGGTPRCGDCGADLDAEATGVAAGLACPRCGKPYSSFPAAETLRVQAIDALQAVVPVWPVNQGDGDSDDPPESEADESEADESEAEGARLRPRVPGFAICNNL